MKNIMWKHFTANNTQKYIDVLPSMKRLTIHTIKDTLVEPVQGTFYEQALQLSVQGIFRIERVFAKCEGYSDAFNSWVTLTDLEQLVIISKQYAWRSAENYRENNPLLPQNLRGLVIGKSGCGKTTVIFNLFLVWKESSATYNSRKFKLYYPVPTRISHISTLTIVLMIYPSWNSNSFVTGYGVRNTIL